MQKGKILILALGLTTACATRPHHPQGAVNESAVTSGYLVTRSEDETAHIVEIQLRKSGSGLKVASFKEAIADSQPAETCGGEGRWKGSIAFLQIHCAQDSYVFEMDFTGASAADLERGAAVQVRSPATQNQWVPLVVQKLNRPFFR